MVFGHESPSGYVSFGRTHWPLKNELSPPLLVSFFESACTASLNKNMTKNTETVRRNIFYTLFIQYAVRGALHHSVTALNWLW